MGMRGLCNKPDQECWEDYEDICRAKYPARFFLSHTIPRYYGRKRHVLRDWYWEVLYLLHPKYKYHQLSLGQPFGYTRGWIDSDRQILYANFNILVNFIEGEVGGIQKMESQVVFYNENQHFGHAKGYQELIDLYNYWKFERLPNYQWDYDWDKKFNWRHEEEASEKETEMLIRLMKVRRFMWT